MTAALVAFLLADAVAGLACVRARRYAHAIGLGGVGVPLAMVVAAVVLQRLKDPGLTLSDAEHVRALLLAFGAVAVAVVCVGWMAAVAVGARRRLRP